MRSRLKTEAFRVSKQRSSDDHRGKKKLKTRCVSLWAYQSCPFLPAPPPHRQNSKIRSDRNLKIYIYFYKAQGLANLISNHFISVHRKNEDGLKLTINCYVKSQIFKIQINHNSRNTALKCFEYKLS